jgi:RNA polymerase sigma-70 factor (ECF subfamily)
MTQALQNQRNPRSDRQILERLMERSSAGDNDAFDELYRRAAPSLLGMLVRLTSDRGRAEDLMQITFLKAYRARENYEPGSPVLPWLHVIARRSMLDDRRPLSSRLEVLSSDGLLSNLDVAAVPDNDDLLLLREALAQLPAQYREAIELTKISGLKGHEAANVLNTTTDALKQRVHRGFAMLRSLLDPPLSPPASAAA